MTVSKFDWRCSRCGEPSNYKSGKTYYCENHWDEYLGVKKMPKMFKFTCKYCGKKFELPNSVVNNRHESGYEIKYCSGKCRDKGRRKNK